MWRADVELNLPILGANILLTLTVIVSYANGSYREHLWSSVEFPLLMLGAEGTQCDAVKNKNKRSQLCKWLQMVWAKKYSEKEHFLE